MLLDTSVVASFSSKLGPEWFPFVAQEVLPCFFTESGQPHSYHHVWIIYGNIADAEISSVTVCSMEMGN